MNDSSMPLLTRAHIRNLEIQIVRLMLKQNRTDISFLEKIYSKDQICQEFYFRKKDIRDYIAKIFDGNEPEYEFKRKRKEELQRYFEAHNDVKKEYYDIKNKFLERYEVYLKKIKEDPQEYNDENLESFKKDTDYNNIISILHWGSLPIYKSEYMEQEGGIPEENIYKYYNDFYTLKDLVKWIKDEERWQPSFKGDCNLNQYMNFSVYSRRWGHRDCYRIKRTLDGWYVQAIAINGDSDKDGTGKIIKNLKHDNIFYYESGVKGGFSYLWSIADEYEMTVGELAQKLQDIADWISGTEIACGKYKPDWL
ncbi:hypothetical protein [Mitsuokella jalaludinii]|uniref:hypothetical protein n=1 Tax=Mitsuokella jalaludinii TaxID=187979 RepID=UPI00298D370B|nr:hypothetical protein [Mitsuokella jalaludinii]